MIKTVNLNNTKISYLPTTQFIPQSLITEDKPYFIELEVSTKEDVRLQDKKITDQIVERISPFGGHSTLISKNRSQRPQPDEQNIKADNTDIQNCLFDNIDKVAKPIVEYPEYEVYQAPNPFAFNTGYHEIIFTKEHVEKLDQIQYKHIFGIFSVMVKRAQYLSGIAGINQVSAGLNLGTAKMKYSAGASQPHLHAQIGAVYQAGYLPDSDRIENVCSEFEKVGIDYMQKYFEAVITAKLDIFESKNFFVFAPFAPRFKDEIHIVSKTTEFSNLTMVNSEQIQEISDLIIKVFKAYTKMRFPNKEGNMVNVGIDSLNIEFLGNRFDSKSKGRLFIKIMPRQSDLAYSELLGRFVIDRYPETTAEAIRNETSTK